MADGTPPRRRARRCSRRCSRSCRRAAAAASGSMGSGVLRSAGASRAWRRVSSRPMPATKRLRFSKLSTISDTEASTAANAPPACMARPTSMSPESTASARMMLGMTRVSWLKARWKRVQRALALDEAGVVVEYGLETVIELGALLRLAAVERDGFGVLPQAHEPEAEVRLAPQLPEVQPDERGAEHVERHHRAHERIDRQECDQRLRDGPQHRAERHQLHHGADEDQQEMRGAAGEAVDVLADALVGVVHRAFCIQLVVAAAAEVAVQEAVCQPPAPVVRECIAHVVVEGIHRHGEGQHDEAGAHRVPEAAAVLCGQRGGHLPVRSMRRTARCVSSSMSRISRPNSDQAAILAVAQPVGLGDGHELPPGGQGEGRSPCAGSGLRIGFGRGGQRRSGGGG